MLIPGMGHCKRELSIRNLSLVEELRYQWEPGDGRSREESLYIVTKVHTTPACAFNHKAGATMFDYYVVNIQQINGTPRVPENFEICTTPCSLLHYRQNRTPYTVLESHEGFARKPLWSKKPHWFALIQYVSIYQGTNRDAISTR